MKLIYDILNLECGHHIYVDSFILNVYHLGV